MGMWARGESACYGAAQQSGITSVTAVSCSLSATQYFTLRKYGTSDSMAVLLEIPAALSCEVWVAVL